MRTCQRLRNLGSWADVVREEFVWKGLVLDLLLMLF